MGPIPRYLNHFDFFCTPSVYSSYTTEFLACQDFSNFSYVPPTQAFPFATLSLFQNRTQIKRRFESEAWCRGVVQ